MEYQVQHHGVIQSDSTLPKSSGIEISVLTSQRGLWRETPVIRVALQINSGDLTLTGDISASAARALATKLLTAAEAAEAALQNAGVPA